MDIYVNGVKDAAQITTAGGPIANNATGVFIGKREFTDFKDFFNGTIDEVAIYNRSLSAAEIQRLYLGSAMRFKD